MDLIAKYKNKIMTKDKLIEKYRRFVHISDAITGCIDNENIHELIGERIALRLEISALEQEAEKEVICPYCGKYRQTQGNGILHQLCECGESEQPKLSAEEIIGKHFNIQFTTLLPDPICLPKSDLIKLMTEFAELKNK